MSHSAERHPDNAAGDFYVECDSCIACEAPYHAAPELIGRSGSSAKNQGCFFRKQPTTADQIDRACNAVVVSCVQAVRYAGNDPEIRRTLYDRGAYASCDAYPTDVEIEVIEFVKHKYPAASQYGVRWTYVREESCNRILIACCYGPYPHTLGVFALDKATREIDIIHDDANYRPQLDSFKRPK